MGKKNDYDMAREVDEALRTMRDRPKVPHRLTGETISGTGEVRDVEALAVLEGLGLKRWLDGGGGGSGAYRDRV